MIKQIKGKVQHYAWGGNQGFINRFVGIDADSHNLAEYWLGTHPSAPATIVNQTENLLEYLQANPQQLGVESCKLFSNKLPFLFKVLDVRLPLSIQLHPNKAQAVAGYTAQQQKLAQGEKLDFLSYQDDNHKPEMMIALSDFWLLHGFKKLDLIVADISGYPSLQPLLDKYQALASLELTEQELLLQWFSYAMHSSAAQLQTWFAPLLNDCLENYQQQRYQLNQLEYWLCYCYLTLEMKLDNLDHGLLGFLFFNLVNLKPGQAIYQAARLPHAYLLGQNLELMATSDNVVRCGLTPKHIDLKLLLEIIDPQPIVPQLMIPKPLEDSYSYQPPVKDFKMDLVDAKLDHKSFCPANAQLIYAIESGFMLQDQGQEFNLQQGTSWLVGANSSYQLTNHSNGKLAIMQINC